MDLVNTLLLILCTFGFVLVSLALSINWLVGAYLEYTQVKEGIRIVKQELNDEETDDDIT